MESCSGKESLPKKEGDSRIARYAVPTVAATVLLVPLHHFPERVGGQLLGGLATEFLKPIARFSEIVEKSKVSVGVGQQVCRQICAHKTGAASDEDFVLWPSSNAEHRCTRRKGHPPEMMRCCPLLSG